MHVLVTGAAGFIGMHAARALLASGARVTGVDNFEPYYDVALKEARVATLRGSAGVLRSSASISPTREPTAKLFRDGGFTHVVHLAAQPGVRHSLTHPDAYLRNNVVAFGHVLEGCRHARVAHLVYASSSSVYGANHELPFSRRPARRPSGEPVRRDQVRERADGAQLRASVRTAGDGPALLHRLRPVGTPRPGADAVHQGDPRGRSRSTSSTKDACERDFTYVDDIVEGVVAHARACRRRERAARRDLQHRQQRSRAARPSSSPRCRASSAARRSCARCPMQPGDMRATYASIDRLRALTGFAPRTPLAEGLVALRRLVSRLSTA